MKILMMSRRIKNLLEKVRLSCIYDNVPGITEHKTWVEVGLKHLA